jgi:hypothetical protein
MPRGARKWTERRVDPDYLRGTDSTWADEGVRLSVVCLPNQCLGDFLLLQTAGNSIKLSAIRAAGRWAGLGLQLGC